MIVLQRRKFGWCWVKIHTPTRPHSKVRSNMDETSHQPIRVLGITGTERWCFWLGRVISKAKVLAGSDSIPIFKHVEIEQQNNNSPTMIIYQSLWPNIVMITIDNPNNIPIITSINISRQRVRVTCFLLRKDLLGHRAGNGRASGTSCKISRGNDG